MVVSTAVVRELWIHVFCSVCDISNTKCQSSCGLKTKEQISFCDIAYLLVLCPACTTNINSILQYRRWIGFHNGKLSKTMFMASSSQWTVMSEFDQFEIKGNFVLLDNAKWNLDITYKMPWHLLYLHIILLEINIKMYI